MLQHKEKRKETSQRIALVVAALCGLTTLARLVASFSPAERLWGLSHLGYFSPSTRIWVTLAALVVLVPQVNRGIRALLKGMLEWVDKSLLKTPLGFAALGAMSWVLFFVFRQQIYYLGDGYILLAFMKIGRLEPTSPEPLAARIPLALNRLLSPWHLSPESIYAILSCTAGVLFLLMGLIWAKTLAKEDRLGRWFAFGVLMTMGIVQQFFGYVENYALLAVAQIAYFVWGLRALEGRCSLLYPILLLGLLISLHLTSLMLVPTLFLLLVERRRGWSEAKKIAAIALAIIGSLMASGLAILKVSKLGTFSRYILPLWGGPPDAPGYSLFSWDHLADVFNLHLLASPVVVPLFFLALWVFKQSKMETKVLRFFLLAALAQLAFAFFFNPEIGASRDWDLLSTTGTVAYTLLLTYGLVRTPFVERGYLGLMMIWTAFFSTASFVALNVSKTASIQRAENLAILDPLRERGERAVSRIDYYRKTSPYFMKEPFVQRVSMRIDGILRKHPECAVAHFVKGGLLENDPASAQREFQIAIERESTLFLGWGALAETHVAQGHLQEAISCYERQVALNPEILEHVPPLTILSKLYLTTGQLDQAIRCLKDITQLTPDKPRVWIDLGNAYRYKGYYSGAEMAFRKSVDLNPNDAMAHFFLGGALLVQNRWRDAELECREAIHLDPKLAGAYSNLGAALIGMGRSVEAESILREGLTIAPDLPEIHYYLNVALMQQGKKEKAEAEHSIYEKLEIMRRAGEQQRK
jgi:tetratricopeptide (TPR) repeat protein